MVSINVTCLQMYRSATDVMSEIHAGIYASLSPEVTWFGTQQTDNLTGGSADGDVTGSMLPQLVVMLASAWRVSRSTAPKHMCALLWCALCRRHMRPTRGQIQLLAQCCRRLRCSSSNSWHRRRVQQQCRQQQQRRGQVLVVGAGAGRCHLSPGRQGVVLARSSAR
jgi:hypothetical protein